MSKRLVIISGSVRWDNLFGMASNLPFYLKKAFTNAGFDVVDISAESQSFANKNVNLVLKFNVYYQFGNQEVLSKTKSIIENFTYDSVLGNKQTDRIFDNVYLSVTYDAGVPSYTTASGSIQADLTKVSKSSKSQPINVGKIATVDIPMNDSENNFLENLAKDFGISMPSPTTLIIVGLLAVIILRRE